MGKLHFLKHPILEHKLSILRDKRSSSYEFREVLNEISFFIAYEATRDLQTREDEIETPLEKTRVKRISEPLIIAPILRAGEGMVHGFLKVLPFAHVAHIGVYRDKAMNCTVEYYFKMPVQCEGKRVIVLDPLLATGDTALAALDRLKEYRVGPITLVSILSSKLGVEKIQQQHPDVELYTVSQERELNEKGYLLPGVGDAGDRLYGTA